MTLSPLALSILCRRLGQVDAAFLPLRRPDWRNAGAVRRAQTNIDDARPLYAAVASDAERQQHARANAELTQAGLIVRTKRSDSVLTAAGERVARGLAWPCLPAWLLEAVNRIAQRAAAGDCIDSPPGYVGQFVPETFIAGTPWGPSCDLHALQLLAVTLLPALRSGVVQAASTYSGHVFYALAGSAADGGDLVDDALADTFDERLADAYVNQRRTTRLQILASDAAGEIGFVPVHAGLLRSGRDYRDLAGIEPLFDFQDAATSAASKS